MESKPQIIGTTFATSHEHRGKIEIVHYVAETDICWDANTTVTIRLQMLKTDDLARDDERKRPTYEALKRSAEQLAEMLCAAPAMSARLAEMSRVDAEQSGKAVPNG